MLLNNNERIYNVNFDQNVIKLIYFLRKLVFISFFLCSLLSKAQDLVYTQNFGSPLYLNPAFAGNLAKTSFYINARQQHPLLAGSYVSSSFAANHRLDNISSGIGFVIKQDDGGSARFISTHVSGIYSYILHVNKDWTVAPALELSFISSRFDESTFVFGDQINDDFSINTASNENLSFNNSSNIDLSSGFIAYNKNAWFGFSTHHITEPNNFVGGGSSLNRKYSFHTGYQYILRTSSLPEEIVFNPGVNINYQAPFTRVGLSFNTTYHYITLGSGISNFTSIDVGINILNSFILLGYSDEHFKVGYSYDFTVNGATGLGGAHEISLGIWLNYDNNSNRNSLKHKKIRKVSCPKF